MPRLDHVVSLATVASIVAGIYDGHVRRKRDRIADERDQRVRTLEDRIAKLEHAGILDAYGRQAKP